MDIQMHMLPQLPTVGTEATLAGARFVGPDQYALGAMFVKAANGVFLCDVEDPLIGELRIGPEHIMDSMSRDYALLPELLTGCTVPMGVCCVRDSLPTCERCGAEARYDVWATASQAPVLLCEPCAEPLAGLP